MQWLSRLFGSMWKCIKTRTFWVCFIVILLLLLLWVIGPGIALFSFKPFASIWVRLTITILVIGYFILKILRQNGLLNIGNWLTSISQNKKQKNANNYIPTARSIRREMNTLVAFLARNRKKSQAKESIYEKPWYLVCGTDTSGKEALINQISSNIIASSHMLSKQEVNEHDILSWVVSDKCVFLSIKEAVFVDGPEQQAFKSLLKIIDTKRKKQPLNGIILCHSVQDSINHSLAEDTQDKESNQYRQIRYFLDMIQSKFSTQIPTYLVVTHLDYIAGFKEYFAKMSEIDRRSILGFTFPSESEATSELFDIKFQELVASLESKMLLNLGFEIDAKINNKIFYFPKQFMRLGYQLQELTSILCDTEYYQSCHLRGLYFTSLFQNEAEYDLITHKAQKAAGFKDFQDRKAYFIDKFVPAILLNESDYGGYNQKYIKDQATMAKFKSLGIGTGTIALIILWVSSYVSNQSYIRTVAQETHEYEISKHQLKPSEILNSLYDISMIEQQMHNRWLLSTGLYKYNDINAMTQKLYSQAIEHYYLPELLTEIKQQLQTSLENASNQDDAFSKQALSVYAVSTWLTIYLMFSQPERMNNKYVEENLEILWRAKMQINSDEYSQNLHALKHILAYGVSAQNIDETLVEQARKSLRGSKDAYIQAYLNLKKDTLADKKSYLSLNNRGTLGFDQVFSVTGGNTQIPMLYTKEGYAAIFLKEEVSYIKTILNQQWVVNGDKNNDGPELNQVKKGMEALYWNDYLLSWNTTLAKIHVNQFSSLQEASQILNLLTSKDNPINDLFKLISFNTNFALSSILSQVKSDDEGTSSKLKEVLLSTNNIVTNQYASFIQMTDDGSGLQQIQQLLTPVRDGLSELLTQIDQSQAAYKESVSVFQNGGKLATSLSNLWQAAQSMPQPAKNILQQLVQNLYRVLFTSAHQYVLDNWGNQVQSVYNRTLANSYPFISSSGNIATVPDFVNFFKKSGVEHGFAQKYLDPLLQTDSQGIQQWAVARDIAFMPNNALLKNIQQSNAIRKLMFSNETGDGFSVTLKPTYLGKDIDVFTIKYNDKIISYANGPQLNEVVSWPPKLENDGNVLLTFHLSDGTVVNQQYDGKWALFKAMSAAKITQTPQNGVYSVEFKNNNLIAKFDLQTSSIGNPFDMSNIQGYQLETEKK